MMGVILKPKLVLTFAYADQKNKTTTTQQPIESGFESHVRLQMHKAGKQKADKGVCGLLHWINKRQEWEHNVCLLY